MDTTTMKQRLHNYLEVVDDKQLEAIYTILESELNTMAQYDDETISMLYQRRSNHLEGKSKSYTVAQAMNAVRNNTATTGASMPFSLSAERTCARPDVAL